MAIHTASDTRPLSPSEWGGVAPPVTRQLGDGAGARAETLDETVDGAAHEAGVVARRKRRHIDVCLTEAVEYTTVTTGFERHRLPYQALTRTDLTAIDLHTDVLGARLAAPVLLGAMTGGSRLSRTINRNLAVAAQRLGLGLMLGSQRVMLDDSDGTGATTSFTVRDVAPDVLLVGNIGLAQVARHDALAAALARVGADALAVHTNPLQEALQPGGDTDFAASIDRLGELSARVGVPVMLKEVGHGLGGAAVGALLASGAGASIAAVDVAGAGGTSWARVEQYVRWGELRHPHLAEWGIPTADALCEVAAVAPDMPLIASGGVRTGTDAAKALALGATAVAVARPLLAPAIESADAVVAWLTPFLDELRVCLHCCGTPTPAALRAVGTVPVGPAPISPAR